LENQKQNFWWKTDVKTTFKDVAGLEGAKEEIQEIVEFLKTQRNTQTLVVKFKRSFTCRSSWTGKTLLAKAVVAEKRKCHFFSIRFWFCWNVCRCRCITCVIYSNKPKKNHAIILSMKLMP
jgi:ATP-dependent Zn protease